MKNLVEKRGRGTGDRRRYTLHDPSDDLHLATYIVQAPDCVWWVVHGNNRNGGHATSVAQARKEINDAISE